MSRLKERYTKEIVSALKEALKLNNVMEVPRLEKIVLNIGMGEAIDNAKAMEAAQAQLTAISGQHPVITRSKKSISAFKLRAGMPIGIKVTLRGERMYDFFDKLVSIVLPRVREFNGVSSDSFDGKGNYSLGLKEQIAFPEVEYDSIDKLRGMEITVITTARTDDEARHLLEMMGMPFSKS